MIAKKLPYQKHELDTEIMAWYETIKLSTIIYMIWL